MPRQAQGEEFSSILIVSLSKDGSPYVLRVARETSM
jgi:hypothetical protein